MRLIRIFNVFGMKLGVFMFLLGGILVSLTKAASVTVRLTSSTNSPSSGRVEVQYKGVWGTICDYSWDLQDATVVCRQLGYDGALSAPGRAIFGRGAGQIWLSHVQCVGNETSISQCNHMGWGVHYCQHSYDASVVCRPAVRLVSRGPSLSSGRVEVLYNGTWGTICDGSWDLQDAEVVCHQLGYEGALSAPGDSAFGYGPGQIWLDDVNCVGNEILISQCSHRGWGVHNCGQNSNAGVVCRPAAVRLVNPFNYPSSGRVEVQHSGTWGTICRNSWDVRDAEVVCRQLGFDGALTAFAWAWAWASLGKRVGQIWLDDLQCRGNETSISECSHLGWGVHDCNHYHDVGVVCRPAVRLVSPIKSPSSGRVEVFYNGTWGTICDNSWDLQDANVVCHELEFEGALSVSDAAAFGQGTGQIWLDGIKCVGNETSISECSHGGWGVNNCGHSEDAGVVCRNAARCNEKQIQTPMENMTVGQLGTNLRRFYAEAKNKSRESYSKSSLLGFRHSFERYLNASPLSRGFKLSSDPRFKRSNEMLNAQIVRLKRQGEENVTHKPAIESEDLMKLKTLPTIALSNPLAFLRNVWFQVVLVFCQRGREGQRQLKKTRFKFEVDASGRRFVTMAHDEAKKKLSRGSE